MAAKKSIDLRDQQHFFMDGASWELYERLIADIGSNQTRVTYDNGDMEIMSPVFIHELWKGKIRRLVDQISFELGMDLVGLGSSTFSREDLRIGIEPDECYYVANWQLAQRMKRFDPKIHPPPDLVLEMDIEHRCIPRQPIFARLGVPEIWLLDGERLRFLHRIDRSYVSQDWSLAFPSVRLDDLQDFVTRLGDDDWLDVLPDFKRWVKSLPA